MSVGYKIYSGDDSDDEIIQSNVVADKKQNTRLFQFAGTARFAYNWAIDKETTAFKNGEKFISHYDLRKEFTKLRNSAEYSWLKTISNNVTKKAIIDCVDAFIKFFKKQSNFPRFKSKKRGDFSFYQDTYKIKITSTHVKLESIAPNKRKNRQKLNWIKLAEVGRIPVGVKYKNPRISFDGLNWWLSVAIEFKSEKVETTDESLGIDLGIKKFGGVFGRENLSEHQPNKNYKIFKEETAAVATLNFKKIFNEYGRR